MSSPSVETKYIRPEDRIYNLATDKDQVDWKNFLYQLINQEGLDPWDIDLGTLTRKYMQALKKVEDVDFDVSGKLLTIAIFLLKLKAEHLVERDLRGIEEKIRQVESSEEDDFLDDNLEALQMLDEHLDDVPKKKEKYSIKVRNPLARKRKVNIFDLIKALEKTFEQSNRRKKNFLIKNQEVKYEGPVYEKKKKDLKTIINELYEIIWEEFSNKEGHIYFSHLTKGLSNKMEVLEKFIPLLHLHNDSKVTLEQEEHFSDIKIHRGDK